MTGGGSAVFEDFRRLDDDFPEVEDFLFLLLHSQWPVNEMKMMKYKCIHVVVVD